MFFPLLQTLSNKIKTSFSIKLPDSTELKFGEQYGNVSFQIYVNTKKGLQALKSFDELKIAEAYLYEDIDLHGHINMLKLLEIKQLLTKTHPFISGWSKIISFFSNQVAMNQKNIAKHYELDHDFYLMFLDKTRAYSHGIFENDHELLEEACTRKLKFAMDSCFLSPGKKVLDLGAGWGSAVEYLGDRDIHVDAITISNQSCDFVSKLIEDKNLSNCRIFQKDFFVYEPEQGKTYDAIFSLGTLEHLPDYNRVLKKCDALLNEGGYAYFDASAMATARYINSHFIERHIFPGNHTCLDIHRFLNEVKKSPFELISVHNDRHNYYLTLKHWAQNLESNQKAIIEKWGQALYRKFQIYFWGCCYGMLNNEIGAYRVVLRKTAHLL